MSAIKPTDWSQVPEELVAPAGTYKVEIRSLRKAKYGTLLRMGEPVLNTEDQPVKVLPNINLLGVILDEDGLPTPFTASLWQATVLEAADCEEHSLSFGFQYASSRGKVNTYTESMHRKIEVEQRNTFNAMGVDPANWEEDENVGTVITCVIGVEKSEGYAAKNVIKTILR